MKLVEWLAFATATAGARNGFRWLHLVERVCEIFQPCEQQCNGQAGGQRVQPVSCRGANFDGIYVKIPFLFCKRATIIRALLSMLL